MVRYGMARLYVKQYEVDVADMIVSISFIIISCASCAMFDTCFFKFFKYVYTSNDYRVFIHHITCSMAGHGRTHWPGVQFDAKDYSAPTPDWALYGSEEALQIRESASDRVPRGRGVKRKI